MELQIEQDLFANEAKLATENQRLFQARQWAVLNLLAAPGAGKTSMIRQTASLLKHPLAVIEGDPAARIDTDLLQSQGIPAFQINTEGGCHLEATMIARALQEFQPVPHSLLIIENVGNLICPAAFPLGETWRVVMLGASEGDDKPFKYPEIFQGADAVLLNKIDLLPYVDFNRDRFYQAINNLRPGMPVFELSCKTGAGLPAWVEWLTARLDSYWGQ